MNIVIGAIIGFVFGVIATVTVCCVMASGKGDKGDGT